MKTKRIDGLSGPVCGWSISHPEADDTPFPEPIEEATSSSVTVTVDGKKVTAKTTPSKVEADAQKRALEPGAPPPPPDDLMAPVPTKDQAFTALDLEGPGPDDPVDWYVDVDFPPIVQKDLKPYADALNVLAQMLPTGNPESQRLIVQMGLTAFGVNDVDKVLDRIFPLLPDGMEPTAPDVVQGPPPLQLVPGGAPQPGAPKPPFGQQPQQAAVSESYAPARVHRLITTLRAAAAEVAQDAVDGTGG